MAAEGSIDEGERDFRGFKEDRIVITANETIEGCEFDGCNGLNIEWCDVPVL